MTGRLTLGTRRSPLARAQTALVVNALQRRLPGTRLEVRPITTSGDRDHSVGASPDFTDAIDRALLGGEIDLAVHSAKDLPLALDRGLRLAAIPQRADPRDCLVASPGTRRNGLPRGAHVGSSSLRRRAQLLRWRPDLDVRELRGNVESRIGRVGSGELDAVVLAVAGITRLGRANEITQVLPRRDFLPAPAQGALAVVIRAGDDGLALRLRGLDHAESRAAVLAEREFAARLGGDCRVPLAAFASVLHGRVTLTGEVLSPDGKVRLRGRTSGPRTEPDGVGQRLGERLLAQGARDLWGVRSSAA